MTELFVVITVIVVALIFDFTNGFHDSANAMAGPTATGAIRPRTAVILGAFLNLLGACLSTEVQRRSPVVFLTLAFRPAVEFLVCSLRRPVGAVIVGAGIASVHGWTGGEADAWQFIAPDGAGVGCG